MWYAAGDCPGLLNGQGNKESAHNGLEYRMFSLGSCEISPPASSGVGGGGCYSEDLSWEQVGSLEVSDAIVARFLLRLHWELRCGTIWIAVLQAEQWAPVAYGGQH